MPICQYGFLAERSRKNRANGLNSSNESAPEQVEAAESSTTTRHFLLSNRQLENGTQSSSNFDMKRQSKAWNVSQQWPPSTSLAVHCQILVNDISLSLSRLVSLSKKCA
jgi:hypothetical protein